MNSKVLIGASIGPGLKGLECFKKLKLGDCVLTSLPIEKDEAMAMAQYCRKNKITVYFSELLHRGYTKLRIAGRKISRKKFYVKKDIEEIIDAFGEYYGGRITLGEAGGILYWPKSYLLHRRAGEWKNLPPVSTVSEAKEAYIQYLREFIDYERNKFGKGPFLDGDSSLVFKYHIEAGVDVLCHEMMPGDPHRMQSAIRGAARAFSKSWGTHIAMACYGGISFDTLWRKRWKTSLYYSFITGAEFIWPESGHLEYTSHQTGRNFTFNSREMKETRRILREIYQFSRIHTRPIGGPRVSLGIVYGNLDGAPGLWNPYVWGQFHDKKWLAGAPEKSWDLVDFFHRREEWSNECVQGEADFSGNPPYGQYDIVPIESDVEILKHYSCLIFLGWNTMTEEIYEKLKAYVTAGGHLVMYLAHLSTHTNRADELKLFRGGDFRDLFGVQITGKNKTDVQGIKCIANSSLQEYRFPLWRINTDPRFMGNFTPAKMNVTTAKVLSAHDDYYQVTPEEAVAKPVLVENSLGTGKAFLVTVWEYPADDGIIRFTKDLLRTVAGGEQGQIRLLSTDRVRYAVYEAQALESKKKFSMTYLLNTDPDCAAMARLWVCGKTTTSFEIPANEMRIAYCLGALVIIPKDRQIELKCWTTRNRKQYVKFFSRVGQKVEVYNLGVKRVAVSINGISAYIAPGENIVIKIKRIVNPCHKEFYVPDFLEEPAIAKVRLTTPY